MNSSLSGKWLPVGWIMPKIDEYCIVSSGYQSPVVDVILHDCTTTQASLQLYGSSMGGWSSEWWEQGMLSREHIESETVIGWRYIDECDNDGLEEMFLDVDKLKEDFNHQKMRK